MLKVNHNRYSYNLISVLAIHKGVGKDIWIRWKSNVPGHEYIQPDDELDLQSGDITFEICSEVPEAVLEEAREIFKGDTVVQYTDIHKRGHQRLDRFHEGRK